MDKLLVTRPETLIGAPALAALGPRLDIVGGDVPTDAAALRNAVLEGAPQLVIHTGPFSVAGWDVGGLGLPSLTNQVGGAAEIDLAVRLAAACRDVRASGRRRIPSQRGCSGTKPNTDTLWALG